MDGIRRPCAKRVGGTVQVRTTGLTAPGPSEEGLYSSAIRVSEGAKNAPAFLYGGR